PSSTDPAFGDVIEFRFLPGRAVRPTLGAAVVPGACAVTRLTGPPRRTSTTWPTRLTRPGVAGPRRAGVGDAVIDLIADQPHTVGVAPRRQRRQFAARDHRARGIRGRDRKSTRLNSSHVSISYAV